jgi:hypothetical protein
LTLSSAGRFAVPDDLDLAKRAISVEVWLVCYAELQRMGLWNRPAELAWLILWRVCGCGYHAIAGEFGMTGIRSGALDETVGRPLGQRQRRPRPESRRSKVAPLGFR